MEILSDATFKGNVTISSGDFSVTRSGESNPVILTGPCGSTGKGKVDINGPINVSDNVWIGGGLIARSGACINGDTCIDGIAYINNGAYITGSEFISDGICVAGHACIERGVSINGGANITGTFFLNGLDISNWSDIAKYISIPKPMPFYSPMIPANCTAFEFTRGDGACVSPCSEHIIQVNVVEAVNSCTTIVKSVIAETWITSRNKPAMSFAGCTSEIPAGTYTAVVF